MAKIIKINATDRLTYGALTVGFMKAHMKQLKMVGNSATTFADMAEMMPLIYASLKAGMGESYPGDEAVDEMIDLVYFHTAIVEVFRAIGFNLLPVPALPQGEAEPTEA
jgi:hypothetical protein